MLPTKTIKPMYDTINFWLGAEMVADVYDVVQYLEAVVEKNDLKGCISYIGKLGDYSVQCKPNGIYLSGSLAKYYLGSNMATLTRATAQEAIERLSDNLHVDMRLAKVTRLDISTAIPTKRPPAEYYSRLGSKPYFQRVQATSDSLYYNTAKQQLAFYDKRKEHRAKGVQPPKPLAGCANMLRYELRYLKQVQRQLGAVDGAMLCQPAFYAGAVGKWREAFESINKIVKSDSIMIDIKTAKDVKDLVLLRLLQDMPADYLDGIIAELKEKHTFADAKSYSRAKSYLLGVLKLETASEQGDELLSELETSIKNVAKYAR